MKKRLRKMMPDHEKIRSFKSLGIFGELLYNPNLWHLNRHSVARAFAVGLFFAWVPVPFQMVLAAAVAIIVHSNLPLSVALVWITNPATMPFLYYFSYEVGTLFIPGTADNLFENFELTWTWLATYLPTIGKPFALGCLICGVVSSILGYFGTKLIWRYHVIRHWKNRPHRHHKGAIKS